MNTSVLKLAATYMFQDGSSHSAVKIIKTFLNSSSRTSVNNLKIDDSFDVETKTALTDFQKSKNLNPTGAMNLKTWLAIGADMNSIQINLVSMSDRTVRDFLQLGYRSKFPFKRLIQTVRRV